MKKILKYIIPVLVFMTVVQSCDENPLDITPSGRITLEDAFSEDNLTKSYLNSTYTSIPSYGLRYFFFAMLEGITDNAYDSDVTEGIVMAPKWYDGVLTPTNNPINQPGWNNYFYDNWWRGIRRANVFLAHIDDAVVEIEEERGWMRAEAKILRAYYYLELIKEYGGMPVFDKPVPADFDFTSLQRDSFDDVVQFIVKNVDEALQEPELPVRITNGGYAGRMTKAIAHAIKSEALLLNASPLWNPGNDVAKWQAAATASKQALDFLTSNGFELYHDYEDYFIRRADYNNNPSDKETIFEIPGTMPFPHHINYFPSYRHQFKAGSTPSQELVDAYDMQSTGEPAILGYADEQHLQPIINPESGYDPDNPYKDRDPRFYATVWYNGAERLDEANKKIETFVGGADGIVPRGTNRKYTFTGYYLRKYLDPSFTGIQGQASFKRYRLAEIYLNYAEAVNEASGPQQAYEPINTIRRRVNMPDLPAGLSQDEMRKRIRNERRVELAFEENRFWDVRRWKILDETDRYITGMRWTKDGGVLGGFSKERFLLDEKEAWEDRFLIFPIPLNEISKMPAFEQNPGW